MTDEQINIAIAESLEWDVVFDTLCKITPDHNGEPVIEPIAPLPNYTSDLNACHDCVRALTDAQRTTYREHLSKIWTRDYNSRCGLFPPHDDSVNATARQRCEAYLRTIGKWEVSND